MLDHRRSPRIGGIWGLFEELAGIPRLMAKSRFTLQVLSTREEEVRRRRPDRGWRKVERRLLEVAGSKVFRNPADFLDLVPGELSAPFDNVVPGGYHWHVSVAGSAGGALPAGDGAFEAVGRLGRAILYVRNRGTRQNPVAG